MGAESCSAVLGNVYDKTNYTNYYSGFHSFESFFCERSFSSYSAAHDAGAQVGIPIEGLPLEIGGYYRDSQWDQYTHELCHKIKNSEQVSSTTYLQLQQVNAAVIQAWSQCVQSQIPGFYFWAEIDDQARTVSLVARWQGTGPDNPTTGLKDKRPQLAPIDVLSCQGEFPNKVGQNPERVLCSRLPNQNGAVTALIRTKYQGSLKTSIPPLPQIELPAPCVHPVLLSAGAHVDVSSNPKEAGAVVDGNEDPGNWNSYAQAPQWVRIDLPQLSTIHHVVLNPEIISPWPTINQISLVRQTPQGDETMIGDVIHTNTVAGGPFTFTPTEPIRGIKAIRVDSMQWNGAVSWREIKVFGCLQ
jgi:hypothetical protein